MGTASAVNQRILSLATWGLLVLMAWSWAPVLAQSPSAGRAANPASRFDGIWMRENPELRYSDNPPLTPAAKAKFDMLRPQDDPGARCMESGVGKMMLTPSPLQMVAFDNHLLIVSEYYHNVRRIWTDRRTHTDDPDPSFYGDSTVKWEGDTMVVDLIGFNGLNWLDPHGDPLGPKMHIVERWKLLDRDTLQIRWTFDDPDNYTHPWNSKPFVWKRSPNIRMAEMSCTENNIYDPTNPANDKNFTSTDKPEPYPDAPSMPYPKKPAAAEAKGTSPR
ncbi:MAG: hypothetical protein M3N50_09925 [Pseudomonadota bacterium]|nr:hypothetical protein [Pseudomonadota bacterium]